MVLATVIYSPKSTGLCYYLWLYTVELLWTFSLPVPSLMCWCSPFERFLTDLFFKIVNTNKFCSLCDAPLCKLFQFHHVIWLSMSMKPNISMQVLVIQPAAFFFISLYIIQILKPVRCYKSFWFDWRCCLLGKREKIKLLMTDRHIIKYLIASFIREAILILTLRDF